jgi:hypothetical protein
LGGDGDGHACGPRSRVLVSGGLGDGADPTDAPHQPDATERLCNQTECQYVEVNAPPCPLHVDMFAEEIKAAEALRAARREGH